MLTGMAATPANSMDTNISSMKEILRSYDMEQLEQLKIIGATIAAEKILGQSWAKPFGKKVEPYQKTFWKVELQEYYK